MMWSKKWYFDFLRYLKENGIHPVDFIDLLIKKIKKSNCEINELYKLFMEDYDEAESFKTYEELCDFWTKEKNFNRLKVGDYGKLNMLYTYKIILENRDEFDSFLLKLTKDIIDKSKTKILNLSLNTIKEILKFERLKFIQFDKDFNLKNNISETFEYNILDWKKGKLKNLEKNTQKKNYKFFITNDHQRSLEIQLKKNKSKNLNLFCEI